jgi:hypothetical protein
MSAKAIKKLLKTSSQDWTGVYFHRVSTSMSSTPDPRDQVSVYSNNEIKTIKNNVNMNIRNAPGYEGWDREYVGDNELRLIYYFSNKESANSFINGSNRPNSSARQEAISLIDSKNVRYSSQWILVDENGQEEVVFTHNA